MYEGEKKFPLVVRWAPAFRKDKQTIRNILVATPDGNQVPLGQLAEVVEEEGPFLVYREDLRRYTPVKFSVRGRDLASTIAEAEQKSLPARHAAPRPPQARRVTTCRAPFMKRVRVAP